MFDQEQKQIESKILEILAENQIPTGEGLKWAPIPFSGEWGTATSFFQTAATGGAQRKESKGTRPGAGDC